MSQKPTPYSPNFEENGMPPAKRYPDASGSPMPIPEHGQPVHLPGFQPEFKPGNNQGANNPPLEYFDRQPIVQQPLVQQTTVQQPTVQPIVQQPGHFSVSRAQAHPDGWMNLAQGQRNCPPGLEYLSMVDYILVHQKLEGLETITGIETNNKYDLKNKQGEKIYYAFEVNDCCTRHCFGNMRPFDIKIFDNFQREVIHLQRPLACASCCCPCCLQSVEVSAPPGTIIGYVEQEWTLLQPRFRIKNATGDIVLRIQGPVCFNICTGANFKVYSSDGETKVGVISKEWTNLARELCTDANDFGVSFEKDMDVTLKAVLLGACFLIDFIYFEH